MRGASRRRRWRPLGVACALACALAFPLPQALAAGAPVAGMPPLALASADATQDRTDGLEDGSYLVDVSLEGGTGRASVESPARVDVRDGALTATIVWSSPNYDYMVVAGRRLEPTNQGGNSTFCVPVPTLGEPLDVVADTTAMSVPHEISYRLTFDPSSARPLDGGPSWPPVLWALTAGGLAVGVAAVRRARRR